MIAPKNTHTCQRGLHEIELNMQRLQHRDCLLDVLVWTTIFVMAAAAVAAMLDVPCKAAGTT